MLFVFRLNRFSIKKFRLGQQLNFHEMALITIFPTLSFLQIGCNLLVPSRQNHYAVNLCNSPNLRLVYNTKSGTIMSDIHFLYFCTLKQKKTDNDCFFVLNLWSIGINFTKGRVHMVYRLENLTNDGSKHASLSFLGSSCQRVGCSICSDSQRSYTLAALLLQWRRLNWKLLLFW